MELLSKMTLLVETTGNRYGEVDILGSWVEVGMVVAAICVGVFVTVPAIKAFLKNKKKIHPCSLKFRSTHTRIHEFLTELRVVLGACRSVILQFHNGGQFLDGSSVKKLSLTHESCVVGVSESVSLRQDLLASNFIDLLEHISKDSPIIELTSNIPDCHFKRHLEANHTLVFSLVPIKDIRGVLVTGCLLMEWCNWDNADEIDDDKILIEVPKYTRYIEGQLHSGQSGGYLKQNGK